MIVLACGALASEIMALKKLNGWEHLELTCIPAQIHNRPKQIPEAVRQKVLELKKKNKPVFVAFADCGTGGQLDKVLDELGVERLAGAHCYEFYAGSDVFSQLHEEDLGTLYLTDFLARHFDALIIRGMGIDRYPEIEEMLFGNYNRLVYLQQSVNEDLVNRAKAAAERLGLSFEQRFTGYGDLGTTLTVWAGGTV